MAGRCQWRGAGGRGGEEGARRAGALTFLYTSGHLRTGEVGTWDQSSPTESRALASPPQSSPARDPVVLRLGGLWVVCAQGADVFQEGTVSLPAKAWVGEILRVVPLHAPKQGSWSGRKGRENKESEA